jgi:hypothetical protein
VDQVIHGEGPPSFGLLRSLDVHPCTNNMSNLELDLPEISHPVVFKSTQYALLLLDASLA